MIEVSMMTMNWASAMIQSAVQRFGLGVGMSSLLRWSSCAY